ncbi:hypothetical protein ACHAPD_011961 [Fusarium lateritium]
MGKQLDAFGRKFIVIIDPHFQNTNGYKIVSELKAIDLAVHTRDGDIFEGHCWPGASHWIDCFNPASVEWWSGLFNYTVSRGTMENTFVWNDMNEPSVFNSPDITMPKDNLYFDKWEHHDLHNLNDCDQAYPRTLSETSQISSLATSCATYTGDIVISKVTATIDLTGVQTIIGSISYEYDDSFENEPITFLSSSLENVTEGLTLSGLAEAKKDRRGRLDVSLPALKITDSLEISGGWGEVSVETDPRLNVSGYFGLNGMTFSNDHGIYATSLYVNISLASTLYLTGLNFLPPDDSRLAFSPFKERKDSFISTSIQRLRRLSITHNPGLTHVLLDSLETATATIEIYSNSDLNHISSSVIEAHEVFFEQNGRDTHLSFPNIKQINGEATFQDLANASLPELNAAYHSNQGSFNFTGNSFPELHLPRLETINCTFVIVNNNILNNIALPRLNEVKNLEIHNNPRLLNVTVNALRKANSINITGPLTNVELFSLEADTKHTNERYRGKPIWQQQQQ